MRILKKLLIALISVLLLDLLSGCSAGEFTGVEGTPHRTHYESLPLDNPLDSAQIFLDAFRKGDFVTVYTILAPAAQFEMVKQERQLQFDAFIVASQPAEKRQQFRRAVDARLALDNMEHFPDTLQHFDALMEIAAQISMLPFTFPNKAIIRKSSSVQLTSDIAIIEVQASDVVNTDPVLFRLVKSPQNKWRLLQVQWPGGDERNIPWALPPLLREKDIPSQQVVPNTPRTFYETLDLSTPEKAIHEFITAFQRQDYPTFFWILDPTAQQAWRANLALFRFKNLVATSDPRFGWQMPWAKALQELERDGVLTSVEANLAFLGGLGSGLGDRLSPALPLVMEHVGDTSYLFDQIMQAAEGNFLVDLGGTLEIVAVYEDANESNQVIGEIIIEQVNSDKDIIIRLRQSTSGRWRVLTVSDSDFSRPWPSLP